MKETSSEITDTFYNVRCIVCGKEIEQKDKWHTKAHLIRRFCSRKCYAEYRRIKNGLRFTRNSNMVSNIIIKFH